MRTLNAPERAPDLVFEVDREHSGVRLLGCFLFLFGSIASYFVLSSLFSNGGLLAVGAALAIAVALTYLGDHLAKRYWPSNRVIQFADDMIQLLKSEQLQGAIHGGSTVNLLMWHFEAKRHPRVPKGWYVVANALEQDGEMIVSYSIASPTDFEALPLSRLSVKFQKKKRKKGEEQNLREAGVQRRIAQAEFHRGELGAELTLDDYHAYLDYLADTYTSWMPKDK
ncbi:MAG: hypothetical protein OXE46_12795 [Chloroflexi bacterium]|nr:hypothetical protein [Chloroflexota bacterium]